MRRKLLEIICCPKCKGDFEVSVEEENEEEILAGKLICKGCGSIFKIEEGIPYLLPEDLR